MFNKILIANRGEIACRIQRTAQRLGYRTVAVFSDADAGAPHVLQADEAVHIGAAPAAESYLNMAALLLAAQRSGADAVHPGYGFLSERAEFAQACADAGLVFIGPPAAAILAMGDKASAKRRMQAAGVPCAPGYLGEDQSEVALTEAATRLGLPLLVKAVAGGGGRGMRLVQTMAQLPAALAGARREAASAFGDGTLMLEKLIADGRHIEVQVFADAHGQAIHLGERDCTAQRRRQKVIEEAPSPVVTPALRAVLGADAVAAAQAVGYRGAGTVEFIVDADFKHYFLEMNTRLQVEHTITECVTGLDLVEWQLRIAAGEALPLRQEQVQFHGHAIQARLVAEDPYEGWKPQTGTVLGWQPERTDVRIDHGIHVGSDITPYYDALVAKFIAHGRDRDDAIRRLTRALEMVPLFGPGNNGRFLRDLLQHPQFQAAQLSTTRLDEWAASGNEALLQRPAPPPWAWQVAAAVFSQTAGPLAAVRPKSVAGFSLTLRCQEQTQTLRIPLATVQWHSHRSSSLRVTVDGVQRQLQAVYTPVDPVGDAAGGAAGGQSLHLAIDGAVFSFTEVSAYPAADTHADHRLLHAPVAGVVAQLAVAVGDAVVTGQPLLCVEAMKMEMWLHAGAAGTVKALRTQAKSPVAKGELLIELSLTEEPPA